MCESVSRASEKKYAVGDKSVHCFQAQIHAAELKRKQERFLDKYVELTGQAKEKLRQDLAHDKYMSASEAVAYGLADMVRARKPRPLPAPRATEPAEEANADAAAADDDVTIVEPPAPAAAS